MTRSKSSWPPMWQPDVTWPKTREVGDLGWQLDAECRDVDDQTSERLVEASRTGDVDDLVHSLCAACPVAAACLQAGQEWLADGTWGGRVLDNGRVAESRRRAVS